MIALHREADLDTRAERLLAVGLTVADLFREAGPAAARATLAQLDTGELFDLATLLCAGMDPDRTRNDMFGWFAVRPEHADEWVGDAPPMRVVWHGDPPALDVGPLVAERYGLAEAKR